jgi:hypothetical protein
MTTALIWFFVGFGFCMFLSFLGYYSFRTTGMQLVLMFEGIDGKLRVSTNETTYLLVNESELTRTLIDLEDAMRGGL